jgi:hypothetical protein
MKICPACGSKFSDDLNYCLQDGATLTRLEDHDPDKTLSYSEQPTLQRENVQTAGQNKQTAPKNYSTFGQQPPARRSNPLFGVLIILLTVGLLIAGGIGGVYYLRKNAKQTTSTPTPQNNLTPQPSIPFSTPKMPTTQQVKLDVQCGDKVKGSFGSQYLKCMVTNTSDKIVSDPSISINLYKGDIKTKTLFGRTDLKYLKPGQTIPIWVDLLGAGDYTEAKAEQGITSRVTDKTESNLYPNLTYSDTKMTSKKATSLYNFKPYTETFYTVSGVVINNDFDKISPRIFVFFYNDNKDIVGISSTSVNNLKKGEKGAFEVELGETQLFGTPKTFEIFSLID